MSDVVDFLRYAIDKHAEAVAGHQECMRLSVEANERDDKRTMFAMVDQAKVWRKQIIKYEKHLPARKPIAKGGESEGTITVSVNSLNDPEAIVFTSSQNLGNWKPSENS